ncbi:hypothetical protein DPMN_045327 [Dreissena polymorpha]|uniref:Notum n=1 Tax=Dreissena polymorpha TaxID=45954 RepID=A0A9D4D5W2_DREPO|nr:hypothetical protein DPMN_045327 [Dreissena polymorpha]
MLTDVSQNVVVRLFDSETRRSANDINLDFEQLEKLGKTDSLIKALKEIAQSSHDCGVRDVPKLRRKFLSNDSITCNDGTPAGYYIRKSYGSKKWIVFLEGGWYCFDSVSCQMRASTDGMRRFMTSKGWPKRKSATGILSWNPEENPYYFHSNIVYIPYCSSDTWSGTAPMGANGNPYAFMGSLILEQVIRDLIPRGLKKATKLILAGSSAGGTGVLVNLDRVADQMAEIAPGVEVRGIADSGWFLDYPQYRYKDCVEALTMWQGRVPEACMADYPESEHWRCYFGYRMYKSLKTPLYVIQHLFDEAQILVDNVFEQTQIRGDTSAAMVTKSQWQYLHKLGQEVRRTLENVTAVFAPACLSHEVLMRMDWFNVSINNIKLGQSIYCWENSYKYDRCIKSTTSVNSIVPLNYILQGDSPKNNVTKQRSNKNNKHKKRLKKLEKIRRRQERKDRKRDNRAHKNRKRHNKGKKTEQSRTRRHKYPTGSCFHHLIDSCPLPQCNASCPKYRNRYTGDEMDFLRMFIRYGIDRKEIAELIGQDVSVVENMDDNTLTRLILKFVDRGS